MAEEPPSLTVADVVAWREWLETHHEAHAGVWLVLAKKGTTSPTSLTYDQALEEALCVGWVDGQLGRGDEATFRRRFSPRRPRSAWSKRNVTIVERLTNEGRMQPAGLAAVAQAQASGAWDAAYAGAATMEVPSDLAAALDATPGARAAFDALDGANRYAVLYRVETAKRADTRTRRVQTLAAMLARGETIHPQRRRRDT